MEIHQYPKYEYLKPGNSKHVSAPSRLRKIWSSFSEQQNNVSLT